jgi:dipeptidyl aminopeptidase/acylaminoacyl peptidase
VGASSDEVLRQVGPANDSALENGHLYYVYHVHPFPTRELDGICYSRTIDGSASYDVAYGLDKKIESVVFYKISGTDSQHVNVPGYDGLMLPAMLYRPRECPAIRLPALIVLHGGGRLREFGYEALHEFPELLAEQGYVVLAVSMRGWHGVGADDCGLSQPKDTARAVEWLGSQPGVDPSRVGLVGFSFGGQVALLTGSISSRVKAVVSYDGPTDLTSVKPWSSVCFPDLKSRSPVTMADKIRAPVLLIEGDSDTTVRPEQAYEMEDALWKSGRSAQLHLVSGAKHGFNPIYSDAWPVVLEFLADELHNRGCGSATTEASVSGDKTMDPKDTKAQR